MSMIIEADIKTLISIDVSGRDKLAILVGEVTNNLIVDFVANIKYELDSNKFTISSDSVFHQHHNVLIPKVSVTSYSLMNFNIIPLYKDYLNKIGITLNISYDKDGKYEVQNESPPVLH